MGKLGYAALLVAIAIAAFLAGASHGASTAAPAPRPAGDAAMASGADGARVAALEQRVDELLARLPTAPPTALPATLPATLPAGRRDAVDTATPALVDAIAALRDAVLQLAGTTIPHAMPVTPAAGTAELQSVFASAPESGTVDRSDLLLLTVPQVAARLGSPKHVRGGQDGSLELSYELGGRVLRVFVQHGYVTQLYVSEQRR